MVISKDNIYEICQAEKGLVIPPGMVAYHLGIHKKYSASSKLGRKDCPGELLVCRERFTRHLEELEVPLKQGEAGRFVYLVWCSPEFRVENLTEISQYVDKDEQGHPKQLTFEEFDEQLRTLLCEALQRSEEFDLLVGKGREAIEVKLPDNAVAIRSGFVLTHCIIRRALIGQDYTEEKEILNDFRLRLQRLINEGKIAEAEARNELEKMLAGIESDRVCAILTEGEKKLEARERLSKYVELLIPPVQPCPFPGCYWDLSVGKTFFCKGHRAMLHASHRSLRNPKVCLLCFEMKSPSVRWLVAVIVGLLLSVVVIVFLISRPLPPLPPLSIYWYGFGQRYEGGVWREFQVQDGTTMYSGDQFRIAFIPNADSYVYIICLNADGSVSQLFPNLAIKQDNLCRRGQEYQVPDGINWFTLDETTGNETMFLVASYDPLTNLSTLLEKTSVAQKANNTNQTVQQQIRDVENQNRPDENGVISTRSGIVVRNVEIQPDKKVAHATLSNGEYIERTMEVIQGKTSAVKRIQFAHMNR
jgi:hypothetical protein